MKLLPPMLSPKQLRVMKIAVWLLALVPFLRIVFLGATDQFGANPLEFVTRSTGTWTLVPWSYGVAFSTVV